MPNDERTRHKATVGRRIAVTLHQLSGSTEFINTITQTQNTNTTAPLGTKIKKKEKIFRIFRIFVFNRAKQHTQTLWEKLISVK